ncbi:MAG: hypothetical protein K8J08_03175 [Thermoanaerobaculia bacterium]|nr:hypothetical protein [Thermoanaerobaculia bacterium]
MKRLGLEKILALLFGLVVASISLAASLGWGNRYLVKLHQIPGGDLAGHFLLVGGLSLVATLAFVDRQSVRPRRDWYRVMVVLGALLTLDELLQSFLPLRSFSLRDLGANYLGITLFSAFGWIWIGRSWRGTGQKAGAKTGC